MTETAEPRVIRDEDLIEAFNHAVKDRGADFQYPDEWREHGLNSAPCKYALEDGTPACIWGLALSKLGVTPPRVFAGISDVLEARDDEYIPFNILHWQEDENIRFEVSEDFKVAAEKAQSLQDNGEMWGDAAKAFKQYYGAE